MRTFLGSVTREIDNTVETYPLALISTVGEPPMLRATLNLPDGRGGFSSPDVDQLTAATLTTERDGTVVLAGQSSWLRDEVRCSDTSSMWKVTVKQCSNC